MFSKLFHLTEKFWLSWNDFENNFSEAVKEPRGKKDSFDVTLACDDEHIQPHKAILSEVDFENNISEAFKEPKEEKDLFDVTLSCDDEQTQKP